MNVAAAKIACRPAHGAVVALLADAGLPTADVSQELLENFYFIGPRTAPFGLVGLELHGNDALLRSLVVGPDHRNSGAGSALVEHAEKDARVRGVVAIYLLTTTAEHFFARRGYVRMDRSDAPLAIRSTREFSEFCPASTALMVKRL